MKRSFHKKNLYTYKQLLAALGEHKQVHIYDCEKTVFMDWNGYLNIFYKGMVTGTVLVNHVFCVEKNYPTVLKICQNTNASDAENPEDRDFCKYNDKDRKTVMKQKQGTITMLTPPGLRDIKQVELYKKWRKFMPDDETANLVCPKPPDDVLMRVSKEKSNKRKAKAEITQNKNNT